jgi:integrase
LTEEDLLTEAEIDLLFRHADADLDVVRAPNGHFRTRLPEEYRRGADNPYAGFEKLLRCYYATGARTSELADCKVRDFLKQTRQVVLGKHKRSRTMKEPTIRRITLNNEAFAIFQERCADKSPDDQIFTQPNGKPWNKDLLDKRFRKVRELATVRDSISVYSFRHLWISEALMAGNDVATVAKMAGTSIRMIERVYGHFRNEHFAEAQRKLDESRKKKRTAS